MENITLFAIILIPAILVVLVISRLNRNQWRRVQEFQATDSNVLRVSPHAMETTVMVISKTETIAPNAGGYAKVDLSVKLVLPGKDPYEISICWLIKIDSLQLVMPGMTIPIKVDPKKPFNIFPNVDWAVPWIFD